MGMASPTLQAVIGGVLAPNFLARRRRLSVRTTKDTKNTRPQTGRAARRSRPWWSWCSSWFKRRGNSRRLAVAAGGSPRLVGIARRVGTHTPLSEDLDGELGDPPPTRGTHNLANRVRARWTVCVPTFRRRRARPRRSDGGGAGRVRDAVEARRASRFRTGRRSPASHAGGWRAVVRG